MKNKELEKLLLAGAVAGNVLYFFWILYNGVSSGFSGTMVEKASFVGILILLTLNSILLLQKHNKKDK